MGCSLLFVIIIHISTVSGVIEVSFEKGVSRLNNSLYCDYYFACHTEGETLQWRVGNNVFNYFGNTTIGSVFYGSASNCNYTATLLSLKPLSSSRSFTSALILTCQSNFNMSINCSDGSLLEETISIPEKKLSLMAETTNSLIYLEHVLSQNLVNEDNSTCTNVFVCGVNHSFMDVQLGNARILFTEFDSIGREHNEIQGTSVQQAILIDKEPYSLVVVMFIVGIEVMNVTCGFSQNIIFLSGMQCHPVTTMPETTGTMESESTSMESELSTEGESSTMASGGSSILLLILGLIIALVVLVAIITIIVFGFFIIRNQSTQPELETSIEVEHETMKDANIEIELNQPTQPEPKTRGEGGPETTEEADTGHSEKNKVPDVGCNGTTYLAMNRGTHTPKLKLSDGDENSPLNLKQGVRISNNHDDYYPMKAKKHGVCLIISDCPAHAGDHDEHNLIETWRYLGYHIEVRREVNYEEFKETLNNIDELLKEINTTHYKSKFEMDSFICFILAHGRGMEKSDLRWKIKKIEIERILDGSEILQEKPKIVFIGFSLVNPAECTANANRSADTFVSYAGQRSYRHPKKGSIYVRVVCKTLCEEAKQKNLTELHDLIKSDVSNTFKDTFQQDLSTEKDQDPHENHTLTKGVHFFS